MYCKTYCGSPNANCRNNKVDTKLMKIVLCCTQFKLNEAVGNTKAKVDTKLIELVLKCAECKLNLSIVNPKARLDTKLK